jgi:hypothetical protein
LEYEEQWWRQRQQQLHVPCSSCLGRELVSYDRLTTRRYWQQGTDFETGVVPHGSAGGGVRRSRLRGGRLREMRVLCCMEKTRHLRGRTWLICVCAGRRGRSCPDLPPFMFTSSLFALTRHRLAEGVRGGYSSRRLTMAAAFPQLLSHCAEGRKGSQVPYVVLYTASPAYGEPYLTDFDFGTSTSYEHRTLNTTGLWRIRLGLHQGGHQLSNASRWS